MSSGEIVSYQSFFEWCTRHGLYTDRHVADAFSRTPQTVRNWKRHLGKLDAPPPPLHLSLACLGYETSSKVEGGAPVLPEVSVPWFQMWRHTHGLDTLEATGEAFGLTRQAIHNWNKRHRLPRWLPLACLGYEERASASRVPQSA